MQGVRSSSLLGSIENSQVTPGFSSFKGSHPCACCPTEVVPCLPISAHDSAHRKFSAHMPQQQWFVRLRGQIKDRCGLGWGIADRNGDTQLTRRINDGKQHKNPRQSVQLGVPWNPAYSGDIFLKICQLKELVDERHLSLAEAKKKLDAKESAIKTITRSVDDDDSGWESVCSDFTSLVESARSMASLWAS